jgi:cbb3-type cytochrome oxidase subunit 3
MQSGLCVGSHTVLPNDTVKIQKHPIPDVEGEIADAICDPSPPQLQESSVLTCVRDASALPSEAIVRGNPTDLCSDSNNAAKAVDCSDERSALVEAPCEGTLPQSEAVICSGRFWQNDSVTLNESAFSDVDAYKLLTSGMVICEGPINFALGCWEILHGNTSASGGTLKFPSCLGNAQAFCSSEHFLEYARCDALKRKEKKDLPPPSPPPASRAYGYQPPSEGATIPDGDDDEQGSPDPSLRSTMCNSRFATGTQVTIAGASAGRAGTAVCEPSEGRALVCWNDKEAEAALSSALESCEESNVVNCDTSQGQKLQGFRCDQLAKSESEESGEAPERPPDRQPENGTSLPGKEESPSFDSPTRDPGDDGSNGNQPDGEGSGVNGTSQASDTSTASGASALLGSNKGTAIGAVVAAIGGVLVLGIAWRWYNNRKKQAQQEASDDNMEEDGEEDEEEESRGSGATNTRI